MTKKPRDLTSPAEMTLDLRGKPCPEPVLATREALEDPELLTLSVLVDSEAAKENVLRLAESQGAKVTVETPSPGQFMLVIRIDRAGAGAAQPLQPPTTRAAMPAVGQPACQPACGPGTVVLIGSATIGVGEEELGRILMTSFLKTLTQAEPRPAAVILWHRGVHLACQGSELCAELGKLAGSGVEVLSCGTCLDYYRIKDKLAAGRVTNMLEIVTRLSTAHRVVRV
jgi:selenium metabolism protein YedF